MLGTPRRTVVAGIAALVVATILLLVYLSHYRSSVKSENGIVYVLRATDFIKKGTTAETLARRNLYKVAAIPRDEQRSGAIIDPRAISGQVTQSDLFPGQQLTAEDFGVTAPSATLSGSADLIGRKGTWRAIAINLDDSHGITPQAQTGDRVDVYDIGGTPPLLMRNVLVLAAPNQSATGTTSQTSPNYILRIPTEDAFRFAYAADNGNIWLLLRPQETTPSGRTPATSGGS
jgi:Flp pilus assembly protein CpaB